MKTFVSTPKVALAVLPAGVFQSPDGSQFYETSYISMPSRT